MGKDESKSMTKNDASLSSLRRVLRLFIFPMSGLFLAALVDVGCSSAAGETRKPSDQAPLVDAKLTAASDLQVPRVITLSGTLIGNEKANVAAGAAGKVLATFMERGQSVKKGEVLAQLDARALRAQTQEATAQLESLRAQQAQSELDCARTQRMFDKGAIAKAEYDRSRTQCETSRWSVSAAEARKTLAAEALRDLQIRAPFTGMVVERDITAGEYVHPDSPVATLVDVDSLRVELTVPEGDVAQVRQGMTVEFRTAANEGGHAYQGKVRYIGPSVRQATRDALIEAVVENPSHELRPGMFVTAKLALGQHTVPGIPATAVRTEGTQQHIFVDVGGRLEDRLVQVGEARGGRVPVLDGVKVGERVVSMLSPEIRDGARVK
jgi:membrane fusion protein (multidrug efflux system)